jgi:hypothetical protein
VTVYGLDDQCLIPCSTVLGLLGTKETGWLERDVDHSPPFSAEIENIRSFTSFPHPSSLVLFGTGTPAFYGYVVENIAVIFCKSL